MKRGQLIKALRRSARTAGVAFVLIRQGSNHEIWRHGSSMIAIPRHREINERTARAIIEHCTEGDR